MLDLNIILIFIAVVLLLFSAHTFFLAVLIKSLLFKEEKQVSCEAELVIAYKGLRGRVDKIEARLLAGEEGEELHPADCGCISCAVKRMGVSFAQAFYGPKPSEWQYPVITVEGFNNPERKK
jgi:hypothetical protein